MGSCQPKPPPSPPLPCSLMCIPGSQVLPLPQELNEAASDSQFSLPSLLVATSSIQKCQVHVVAPKLYPRLMELLIRIWCSFPTTHHTS